MIQVLVTVFLLIRKRDRDQIFSASSNVDLASTQRPSDNHERPD